MQHLGQRVGMALRILTATLLAAAWVTAIAWSAVWATDNSFLVWLEHGTGDIRTGLLSHRPKRQHEKIALVVINDTTMQPYPYRSPIDRRLLANLITGLDEAGVSAIGLDFLILKPTEKAKDDELVAAIARSKTRVVIAVGDHRVGLSPAQTQYQAELLKSSGAIGGYANLLIGDDRVVRYVASPADKAFPLSFAAALTNPTSAKPANGPRRIAWLRSPLNGNDRFFSIPAHLLVTPDGNPTPVAPALLARFKGKLVIVGADFPDIDRHRVPLLTWTGEEDEIAGMLIQAQVAAQLFDGRSIEHLDRDILFFLFLVLAALALWFGSSHGIVAITAYATTASIVVVLADLAVFYFMGRVIPFGACLAALAGGVVGGIIWRWLTRLLTQPA